MASVDSDSPSGSLPKASPFSFLVFTGIVVKRLTVSYENIWSSNPRACLTLLCCLPPSVQGWSCGGRSTVSSPAPTEWSGACTLLCTAALDSRRQKLAFTMCWYRNRKLPYIQGIHRFQRLSQQLWTNRLVWFQQTSSLCFQSTWKYRLGQEVEILTISVIAFILQGSNFIPELSPESLEVGSVIHMLDTYISAYKLDPL